MMDRGTTPGTDTHESSPQTSQPFRFPRAQTLPVRDHAAGIAFGAAGMKATFHVGVLHAFVISGYFPRTIAGTSAGSLTATVLAQAAELDDQGARMALVADYLKLWLDDDPGGKLWEYLVGRTAPVRKALDTLLDLPRDVGEPGGLVRAIWNQHTLEAWWWGAPLVARLLWRHGRALWNAALARTKRTPADLWRVFWERRRVEDVWTALFPDGAADVAQVALDAFGLERSLTGISLDKSPFADFFTKHLPGRSERTMDAFGQSHLVFEVANISQRDEVTHAPQRIRLSGKAKLWAGIKAACAFTPLFTVERASGLYANLDAENERRVAKGESPLLGDDIVIDGAIVQRAPLSPVIASWKARLSEPESPPLPVSHRLFVVYLGPVNTTAVHRKPGDKPPGLVESGLRSLQLLGQEDMLFNARVVSLITQMVRALKARGAPESDLKGFDGARYVEVDCTPIAPDDLLPMEMVSAPAAHEHASAIASGCRAALEALHAETLAAIEPDSGKLVPCASLLADLKRRHGRGAEAYFEPAASACSKCTRLLRVHDARKVKPHIDPDDVADFTSLRDDAPRHDAPGDGREGIEIIVPAGGVFRGVFQVGAIAALKHYGFQPRLYAGGSVGTLFSFLLDAAYRAPQVFDRTIHLMQTLPDWVDRAQDGRFRFDELIARVGRRWDAHPAFRRLRVREVVDAFAAEKEPPQWAVVADALALDRKRRSDYRACLQALARVRLGAAVPVLDEVLARWGLAGGGEALPELIGFDGLERELDRMLFAGASPPRPRDLRFDRYSDDVRFIFTVTNHDDGTLEHLGIGPSRREDGGMQWSYALQSPLAASSFPVAFRLRTARELYGDGPAPPRGTLYADGGILDNFPSDSAFAYLRALATREGYGHLAAHSHRVVLLSLTEPMSLPTSSVHDDHLVSVVRRAGSMAEQEKVHRTLITQQQINYLARRANPVVMERVKHLRAAGAVGDYKPAIRAEFVYVAPAQPTYPHPFAFKPELGFKVEKQNAAIAAGCRRTRMAMEWEKYARNAEGAPANASDDAHCGTTRLERRACVLKRFEEEVRAEWVQTLQGDGACERACIMGHFTHDKRPQPCAFRAGQGIYAACRATALADEAMRDLVGVYATPDEPATTEAPDGGRERMRVPTDV